MRRLPWKSVPCEHCNEETQPNCDFCLGSGREIRRVSDEREMLQAALDGYRKWVAGFRAAVRPWMGR